MDSTLACLTAWMPRQRWYATKGRSPRLRMVSWWDFEPAGPTESVSDADQVLFVRTYLVADDASDPAVLYQVPVVARAAPQVAADDPHEIGRPDPDLILRDGPYDDAYAQVLLSLVTRGGTAIGPGSQATGHPAAAHDERQRTNRVMTGEQSNTSLVFEGPEAMPVICKIYRQLHPGHNPDIELPGALAAGGSPHVPAAVGWIEGSWPSPGDTESVVRGSLASAQEFLPGVQDAWRVALNAAASGADFRAAAEELGIATADVHVALARLFPQQECTPAQRDAVAAAWNRRLSIALDEVPALSPWRSDIEAVYATALRLPWPALQRIHGDYHLGQVLRVPGRGWVLLDFEGEPLRPMDERTLPDLALRDVAGMLRSFDYVAGSLELERPDQASAVRDWARTARESFLRGYAAVSFVDLTTVAALLTALEMDKAVYEAIYEVRNRPAWTEIPLGAVKRLIAEVSSPSNRR
ncbi:maltokinase N-terminal cap-like domain-containing protein [Microbacterium aurantiacum]|uniref:maltokinase N-terminal cap-like domain-containing protein n=1 Tax=Microbacterium aurantiacum TaxID=162393 RepID=UPI003444BD80